MFVYARLGVALSLYCCLFYVYLVCCRCYVFVSLLLLFFCGLSFVSLLIFVSFLSVMLVLFHVFVCLFACVCALFGVVVFLYLKMSIWVVIDCCLFCRSCGVFLFLRCLCLYVVV